MEPANIIELNGSNFKDFTSKKGKAVIVDFWAPWCMPCRAIAPVLTRLAEEYPDNLLIGKLNVDDNQPIAYEYGISSIPNVYIYKDGEIVEQIVGARPFEFYKSALSKHM